MHTGGLREEWGQGGQRLAESPQGRASYVKCPWDDFTIPIVFSSSDVAIECKRRFLHMLLHLQ